MRVLFVCLIGVFLYMLRVLFRGGVAAVPAFLVCAGGCAGRTMGCVTIRFWARLIAALFLKRSVNE